MSSDCRIDSRNSGEMSGEGDSLIVRQSCGLLFHAAGLKGRENLRTWHECEDVGERRPNFRAFPMARGAVLGEKRRRILGCGDSSSGNQKG